MCLLIIGRGIEQTHHWQLKKASEKWLNIIALTTYTAWTDCSCCNAQFVIFIVTYIVLCSSLCCNRSSYYDHYNNFCVIYSKLIFRDALKKKENPHRILLHKYEINKERVKWLIPVTSIVMMGVFLSFWGSFLIEETFVCDPLLDCFYDNSSKRLEDCADVSDNITVTCFQFVLNISAGFASAIGFLAVIVVYIYVYGYLLIWLMEATYSPKCTFQGVICTLTLLLFLPLLLGICGFIIVISVPFFSEIALKTTESTLNFIAYSLCFIYVGPFTGIIIYCLTKDSIRRRMKEAQEAQNLVGGGDE